ncbi:MAG: TIGR01459 family HAD-type hydrolase [Rubrimonas sp.]
MSDAEVPIIDALADVAGLYDVVFCDLWGCYHNGLTPYPAAVSALRAFRARGGTVVLMTNAPRTSELVSRHLAAMGAPSDSWDAIISSGDASLNELAEGRFGARTHYVGPERDLAFAHRLPIPLASLDQADSIFCVGLRDDESETPAHYAGEIAAWRDRGLPMLCANPDIIVDRGDQRLYCAGALAEAYAAVGGEVTYTGKPHAPIYRLGRKLVERLRGGGAHRILAIGDGILTDVLGGVEQGIDTLFVTGGLAAEAMGGDVEAPEPSRLAGFLRGQPRPTYAIGRLR